MLLRRMYREILAIHLCRNLINVQNKLSEKQSLKFPEDLQMFFLFFMEFHFFFLACVTWWRGEGVWGKVNRSRISDSKIELEIKQSQGNDIYLTKSSQIPSLLITKDNAETRRGKKKVSIR